MAYALLFGLVYLYGAGVALPICYATLTFTRPLDPWARLGVALIGSFAWPALLLGVFLGFGRDE